MQAININHGYRKLSLYLMLGLWLAILSVLTMPNAMALNLTVTGVDNTVSPAAESVLGNFRWLVEEDKTYHVPLNTDGTVTMEGTAPAIDPNWRSGEPDRNTVSVNFHHSYMPVVMSGDSNDLVPLDTLDPARNYFISILPDRDSAGVDYSIGGAQIIAGQTDVTVYVNKNPIPTAQIIIFVHEDMNPINNVWDAGEPGLANFSIILEDAGGKYGASAGIQSQDAFGNPLCTSYNPDGTVNVLGSGCVTDIDGKVTIRNLAPGKYGIMSVPPNAIEEPAGSGNYVSSTFIQTSTIEGKKVIDTWVKANEPAFFGEFGPPGPHVSIGYVRAGANTPFVDLDILTGGATISGQVVNLHISRPADTAFFNGGPFPHTTPWVGLNMGAAGMGKGVYAARANDDGSFAIDNVPPGQYQLVVWDDNMDILFAKSTVIVNSDAATPDVFNGTCNTLSSCNLGDVPVFQWFARMEHYVYNDKNENGIWDDGELPMIEQNVNLRFRDGTIYQAFPTDGTGVAPFDEVFPFFSWLVAEVDFARFKATGATVIVDDGGAIPFGDPLAFDDNLTPQIQNNPLDPDSFFAGDLDPDGVPYPAGDYRVELGPVLTQGFQGFLGQTNVVQWGKAAYGFGENGGISGVVMYAVTRAEDNPEVAAAEPWEPGIPGVTVNLYNNAGDFLTSTTTDSWDDSLPTNCQHGSSDPFEFRGVVTDCYDGMRLWNQVRPGVFDGGYAFGPQIDCPVDELTGLNTCPGWVNQSAADPGIGYIKPGQYTVEVIIPEGYEIIKSQDRNVDFGDVFSPAPELLAPSCVGADYTVPSELSLFPGEPAPLAGQTLPLCDRKLVTLSGGANAAADFFVFTQVPISGHFIGFILDDTANEFDPTSPQFGEKYAPPFLPVSIRDWTGREISRTVSDENGVYNALIPSTLTENLSQPSGVSPNMLTTCMNAKTRPDGSSDPLHNPQYSQFCYTFQYMPGSTTYLDTPVVPVAAFAGPDQNPLDCNLTDTTPGIYSVTNGNDQGPYVAKLSRTILADGINDVLTIKSMQGVEVTNPAYDGIGGTEPKTILRDYGFGTTTGTVTIGDIVLTDVTWSDGQITARVPAGTSTGQLVVTRGDNLASSTTGVTVQIGLRAGSEVIVVSPGPGAIQAAINGARNNALILVKPGTYNEMVIMWKPVQLQGWGEGSVNIDAIKTPFEKLTAWRTLAQSLVDDLKVDLVDGQENGFGGIEPDTFFSEEGAGVFVLAKIDDGSSRSSSFKNSRNRGARIDGLTISGADTGGGVVVNGHADYLEISNNRIVNNSAFFAGGIRVGHPMFTTEVNGNIIYSDAKNNHVQIHHNTITQNGGLDAAGGGIALHTGSDSYQVTDNFVCGNFTTADGAGIAHYGFSHKNIGRNSKLPLIANNTIVFNENFNQGVSANGGGILVAGMPAFGCPIDPDTGEPEVTCVANPPESVLSPGSGSVQIIDNLIQGNSAGAGDGAGIRLSRINGQEVLASMGDESKWHKVDIVNNIIVNNVAALAGGGISLQDALLVSILHNTIANNFNTSTAGDAFAPGSPSQSTAQPGAGIVSRAHSAELKSILDITAAGFSEPNLVNNIIWHNQQFYWLLDDTDPDNILTGLCPDIGNSVGLDCGGVVNEVYDDLAVIPTGTLNCTNCIVSTDADPVFVDAYVNGNRNTTAANVEVKTAIQAPPAFDEGGNFIRLRYGPLTLLGDYHTLNTSSALDMGSDIGITTDIDGEIRPNGLAADIGADEVYP